jgi:glucose/arabinose dehydrogenase
MAGSLCVKLVSHVPILCQRIKQLGPVRTSKRHILKGPAWPHIALIASSMVLFGCSGHAREGGQHAPSSWETDWAVESGFALEIDTEGYQLPSAIAFVPKPGPRPDDPLYFVTELRGKIKVVTNDRSVHTFAAGLPLSRAKRELPDMEGETGMAGICLDPRHGFVFVTLAYTDKTGTLRNGIIRLQTAPGNFGLKPTSVLFISAPFAQDTAVISHQIGGCQVDDDHLFVSVADGRQTSRSRDLQSTLGKVLRMTLAGKPSEDNPFYSASDIVSAKNYVWAYGFRNPFGLKFVADHLLTADNGMEVDRLVNTVRSADYLWDGTDSSIGTNALAVFTQAIGPVQMDFMESSPAFPKQYWDSLFIASSSDPVGIVEVGYDPVVGRITRAPRQLVRFVGKLGNGRQQVVGVGVGPDGLYVVPIVPDRDGRSAVYKVRYDPMRPHAVTLANSSDPLLIMRSRGCFGCHSLDGEGGKAGPNLDRNELAKKLRAKLDSAGYVRAVTDLRGRNDEPFRSTRAARDRVLQARGDERVRQWLKYHIMEPRFDNPDSLMPNVGATDEEASAIAEYLMPRTAPLSAKVKDLVRNIIPQPNGRKGLILAFFAGAALAGVALLFLWRKDFLPFFRSARQKRARTLGG